MGKKHLNFRNLVTLTISLVVLSIFSVSVSPAIASKVEEARLKSISVALKEIQDLLNFTFFDNFSQKLTKDEIIFWTNDERFKAGLPALENDLELDSVAQIRLSDMEEKQYFEHYSPEGRGISEEAISYGYQFIAIGENLAEGDFKDSQALVEAWMNSPGHRENILKDNYTRIGIAAKEVIFEGRKTWLVVQAFSRPLSECDQPSKDLKAEVEREREALQILLDEANEMHLMMNRYQNEGNVDAYNRTVPIYNDLVKQVNKKTDELESVIASYNGEVAGFNYCLEN